jgi:hypothetical protein
MHLAAGNGCHAVAPRVLGRLVGMSRTSAAQELEHAEVSPSPFRDAFGRARGEALAAGGLSLEDDRQAGDNELRTGTSFEYRLERRRGKRSADEADWNALGRQGWELVGVTEKHAAFKRPL